MRRPVAVQRSAARNSGKRSAGDVKRQRFSQQVRVRAEIVREVVFDVRQLPLERDEQVDQPG